MHVGILGPLEVTVDGARHPVNGVRLRALLIRLALSPGRLVSVDALADALWGDRPPTDQVNAVQTLISRLRRTLPRPEVIESGPTGYRLALAADRVDAARFEQLARDGRRALRDGDAVTARRLLDGALDLWRGPPLADAATAPFAEPEVHRLEGLRLTAVEDRIEADLSAGSPAEVVPELEGLAAAHPLRERPVELLVKGLHASGRTAEALAAYETFRTRLAEDLGTDPSANLRDLHVAVLRGDPALAATAPAGQRNNLRAATTSFIGRDDDVKQIDTLLDGTRLITLVGPGGTGKTRLATTVAATLTDRYTGGVWLVELAPVTDPDHLAQTILEGLRGGEAAMSDAERATAPDSLTRLVKTLGGAPALLMVDNCEHLIEAVARLVDELLGRCAELRVLTTSREPLGVAGETVYPVSTLAHPATDTDAADALSYPAVRLFADRARSARPDFTVDDGNVGSVVEICRRLDGLPLAIELAAVRLRSLPSARIAARLGDRFKLLTTGSRTALPRHQTLHAVVEWSWELLSPAERDLAAKLSVFPGDITPDSAAGVIDLDVDGVFDLLAGLVDKSLLQVVPGRDPRYRMLETIREFGRARLAADDALQSTRAAHAAYFLRLAETAEPYLRSAEQLPWIDRLIAEQDNLLAALRFALDTGDADTAVRFGAALGQFWTIRSDFANTSSRLKEVLSMPGADRVPVEPRAVVAVFFVFNSAEADAVDYLEPIVAELRDHPKPPSAHMAVHVAEAGLAIYKGDPERTFAAIDEAVTDPEPWAKGFLYLLRAEARAHHGRGTDGIRADLETAEATFRGLGERLGLMLSLYQLADQNQAAGDLDAAEANLVEAKSLAHELNSDSEHAQVRLRLAAIAARRGDPESAEVMLRELVETKLSKGPPYMAYMGLLQLSDVARQRGDPHAADEWCRKARDTAQAADIWIDSVSTQWRVVKAHTQVALGELAAARATLAHSVCALEQSMYMPMLAAVAVATADLLTATAEPDRAAQCLGAADTLRSFPDATHPDVHRLATALRRVLGADFESALARGAALGRAAGFEFLRDCLAS